MAKKLLIGHLISNGDCLMATVIARQIKADYPGSHVTWAISFKCRQAIENNPYVDAIWEVYYDGSGSPYGDVWYKFKEEAELKKRNGEFDTIIYSQINPHNISLFDGTTRSTTLRAYPNKITVPVNPVMRLYQSEISNASFFADKYKLSTYRHVVLCECTPSSGQSFLTQELMMAIIRDIVQDNEDIIFIISSHIPLNTGHNRIIDASVLSFRENAELSKHCTLLIGCSSGITWLLSCDWAKKLPTVQFLNNSVIPFQFASVKYDFKYWGLNCDHVIESTQQDLQLLKEIVANAINNFKQAKSKYDEDLVPKVEILINFLKRYFSHRKSGFAVSVILNFTRRNKLSFADYLKIVGFFLKDFIGIFRRFFKSIFNR